MPVRRHIQNEAWCKDSQDGLHGQANTSLSKHSKERVTSKKNVVCPSFSLSLQAFLQLFSASSLFRVGYQTEETILLPFLH